ncbi:SHOCT domain-containing protein [Clostridium aestuarii]|uniref:SHOCT domain-containing protein n=1 Tax=Clostridium aestuarii TaxID=338193 RepID=A0ABT4D0S0_9CLOT|nr:SHOCT domain-containing protein [Clostridium aestuarii]MCY6483950.1 SHOCT domain-containing protein [Clostridium aestuarii]
MINTKNFSLIVSNPKLIGELCELLGGDMPNWEMSTAGGKVFWNNLIECNGWRLQQNKLTGHCRILDPNDYRKAWGSESVMRNAINRILQMQQSKETSYNNSSINENKEELLKTLEKLGELRDKGILSQEEFNEKKVKILSQI